MICSGSAVMGAVAIYRGWGSVSRVAFNVAFVWLLSGSWLDGDFTRQGWKRLNSSMAELYRDARQGKLSRAAPLSRVMTGGGGIIFLLGLLHFEVTTRQDALAGEGLPYTLDQFSVIRPDRSGLDRRTHELPLNGQLLNF